METYEVLSDNFAVAPRGSTVAADQLAGCDVPALVEAGHLAPVKAPKATDRPESPTSPESSQPSQPATPATETKEK